MLIPTYHQHFQLLSCADFHQVLADDMARYIYTLSIPANLINEPLEYIDRQEKLLGRIQDIPWFRVPTNTQDRKRIGLHRFFYYARLD